MTSVVTGANGHVGANLVRQLDGPVRAIVHRNQDALVGTKAQLVHASLGDRASLETAFAGADTVYHLAAKVSIQGDPDGSVHQTNVVGARNAAEAALAAGVKKFVHVSSVHAFDLQSARDGMDESHAKSGPKNYAYDHSKAMGEAQVREVVAKGLDATIVNPTGIIGPYDFAPSRMGEVFLELRNRSLPSLVAGSFDFVDVRDVVDAAIAASIKGRTGENYLLGGTKVSVRDIAHVAESVTGVRAPRLVVPRFVAMAGVPFAALQARLTGRHAKFTRESLGALAHCPALDCSKARKELGHNPRPLADSVRDIYAWFDEAA